MAQRIIRTLFGIAMLAALAGCPSTAIRTAWIDPGFSGPPFLKLVVVGIHGTVADRRVFEDVFSYHLRAAGVEAVPGYQLLPDDAKGNEPRWNAAVEGSGADAVLMVRVARLDTRTQISPASLPRLHRWGPYGWYPGWVAVADIRQFDVATVETSLFDVRGKRLAWAATSETFNATSVAQETAGFAEVIIGALAQRGLISSVRR